MDKSGGLPFSATGRGHAVRIPKVNIAERPNQSDRTATAILINKAISPQDEFYSVQLWIRDFTTGYTLATTDGQGRKARAIYPRNATQTPVTIQGVCANQYQKDRLVEFITRSWQTTFDITGQGQTGQARDTSLTFILYWPNTQDRKTGVTRGGSEIEFLRYEAEKYDVYATDIDAGHQKGVFAPEYTLVLMVSNDYFQEQIEVSLDILKTLKRDYERDLGLLAGEVVIDSPYRAKPSSANQTSALSPGDTLSKAIQSIAPDVPPL